MFFRKGICVLTKLIKNHPYITFGVIMLFFMVLETALTPLMTFLADEGFAVTVPLGYFLKALAYIPPFLMIGAVARKSVHAPFSSALIYFAIFAAADLIGQIPLAYDEYTTTISSPFWFLLIVYMIISLLHSSFFLVLLFLGYLLFTKRKETAEERFFGLGGSDVHMSLLAILAIAVQDLVVFAFSFFEYLDSKLFLIDGIDILQGVFSLFFVLLCAFIAFCSARFGAKNFGAAEN